MPIRIRRARASSNNRASDGEARPDNLVALVDQGFFAGHRAIGQQEVMQVVWVYEHAIDFDGLKRFHHNLGYGLSGRRSSVRRCRSAGIGGSWIGGRRTSISPSVPAHAPNSATGPMNAHKCAVDPERGPGWHLSVLPLTDGSTAVSLVISHYIVDGVGGLVAVVDAILGNNARSSATRHRGRAPDCARWLRMPAKQPGTHPRLPGRSSRLAKMTRRNRREAAQSSPAAPPLAVHGDNGDETVVLPGIAILVDLDHWHARAEALGGTGTTLAAGLAAKLAEHLGRRRRADGAVTLQVVMSNRTEGDTRALAVSFARVSIDPTVLATDLRDARAAIKQSLETLESTPDESSQLAALAPFTPKRMWKQGIEAQLNDPDLPVIYSNLGDAGMVVSRADGTQCEHAWARGTKATPVATVA